MLCDAALCDAALCVAALRAAALCVAALRVARYVRRRTRRFSPLRDPGTEGVPRHASRMRP